ncbi:YbjN domain-containing protein [Dialister hominis]|jgi:hypothetical protein|uniref:YbjN domain-containing protein n=1 Tax=Dialister hominis TaxID=2582419 RepID=UPI002EB0B68C|nr:YbjN domain-containing protein [Dialister hominis]
MNKKAESFQEYLDKRKLKDFAVEEIAKDPLETAVFRSHMQLENARLPIIVILDKSIYGIVRLLVAQSAKKKNNEKALEELMNKFNKQYKAFKYYLDDEGNLVLDLSILCPEEKVSGPMIYALFQSVEEHLKTAYPQWMKIIWK